MLVPKLVTTLRGYTRAQLAADATAGFVVGIVALPLAIAFAIASGVPFFFGAAEKFKETITLLRGRPGSW